MEFESLLDAFGRGEASRALLEQFPAGLCLYDRGGTLLAHNDEIERLVGPVPARADDLRLRQIDQQGATAAVVAPARAALDGKVARHLELECTSPDGTARWVRVSAMPIADGKGERKGAMVMIVDTSERRSLEVLGHLVLGVVAHDMRNPLSALRMTTAMLARTKEMPTERRVQLAERMLGTIGRMEGMVASLLDYTRSETSVDVRLVRQRTDLEEATSRVRREMELLFPGRTIMVTAEGRLDGQWDPMRIERVLGNLLSNALKHGSDETPITVRLDGGDVERVVVSVHNQGTPIPADLLPRITEPFVVGPIPEGERRRNIGLGLFIVHHLVVAHGGTVDIRSTAEAGTTVTISLPRAPVPAPAPTPI